MSACLCVLCASVHLDVWACGQGPVCLHVGVVHMRAWLHVGTCTRATRVCLRACCVHVCMGVYVCGCVRECVCVCVCACHIVQARAPCACAGTGPRVPLCMRACVRAVRMGVCNVHMCVCVSERVCASVWAHVRVQVRVCVRVHMGA